MILLPCPVRPDIDCIAGAVAYAAYLSNQGIAAKIWLCGTPDGEAQFYLDLFKTDIDFATKQDIQDADGYILVDFSSVDFFPEPIDKAKVIEVIDHRFFNTPDKDFPNARIQLDQVGAAATQITEYFIAADLVPSHPVACMLYGAIYSHTLCTLGSMFCMRDDSALKWLLEKDPLAAQFVKAQLDARKQEIVSQFPDILSTEMKTEQAGFGPFGISQLEMKDGVDFWNTYKEDIIRYFENHPAPIFLNLIDLSTNASLFYFSDKHFQNLFKDQTQIMLQEDNFVLFKPALMRKQIIPLIQKY